jgi:hypothetical protein
MSVPAETIGLQDRMRPFIGVGFQVCKGSQRIKPASGRRTLPSPGLTAAGKQKQGVKRSCDAISNCHFVDE